MRPNGWDRRSSRSGERCSVRWGGSAVGQLDSWPNAVPLVRAAFRTLYFVTRPDPQILHFRAYAPQWGFGGRSGSDGRIGAAARSIGRPLDLEGSAVVDARHAAAASIPTPAPDGASIGDVPIDHDGEAEGVGADDRSTSTEPADHRRKCRPTTRARNRVMKVRASVRRVCEKCKVVRRRGVVFVVCADPRHKQRQG